MTPEEEMYAIPRGTRRGGSPPEQHPGREPRGEVHEQIDAAHEPVRSQGVHELPGRVLEPEGEQQQDQTDLRPRRDELVRGDQGHDPALPEREPREQVERIGENPNRTAILERTASNRTTPPSSIRNSESCTARPERSRTASSSIPLGVPTTTRTSPARSSASGPGAEGGAVPQDRDDRDPGPRPRSGVADRATHERRAAGEHGPRRALDVLLELGELLGHLGHAEGSASVRPSSGPRRRRSCDVSGSSRSNSTSSRTPDRWCTTPTSCPPA